MSEQTKNSLTLTEVLEAYRCMHIDKSDSALGQFNEEKYSNLNILDCSSDERLQFSRRIQFDVTLTKTVTSTEGELVGMTEIINSIYNNKYINTQKTSRPVIYSSNNGERHSGNNAYTHWNGFQVIDIDVKSVDVAKDVKQSIFNHLSKYSWFLGVALSTSGNGVHVYTKILVQKDFENKFDKINILYKANYRHKCSLCYIASISPGLQHGFTKEEVSEWFDMAMFRPAQGVFVTNDRNILISSNFYEDFIYVDFDVVTDMGHPDIDWLSCDILKYKFKRWEWFGNTPQTKIDVVDNGSIDGVNNNQTHYKHFARWRIANTLVSLYGLEKGYELIKKVCTGVDHTELYGDCSTAYRHAKGIDEWAVKILNDKHGFNIKINKEVSNELDDLCKVIDNINNPVLLKADNKTINFNISKDQYLGHIKEELLNNISNITLIEAGAGVGKTEMVKSLSKEGKKVMMVMPFTSTIKAKVEGDENWTYSYGNKKFDINSGQSITLTIDKFSRISILDLQDAGYDYIFIDESHLMFQSEYRSVMPKVIDIIRLSGIPIIMMSGTPVGELVFFPDATHIKVIKEDIRKKEFNVTITDDEESVFLDMCRSMAKDISLGRRVLLPTNKGSIYKEQIQATVQYFIEEDFNCRYKDVNPILVNYYKKSNTGESFMDDININKTIGDTDILLCSNYLSVGVDIEDKYEFSVYINDLWMPQEIEQFANRLRNNNLFVYLYVSAVDSEGNDKGLYEYKDIDLKLNDEEIKACHAILQICNSTIERNPTEYRYNSIISSIIHNNKYISYNELENKYYLNETAYKVTMFELKYRNYVCQLPTIVRGMQSYGYEYIIKDKYRFSFSEKTNLESVSDIKKSARVVKRLQNTTDIEELLDLITDDRLSLYNDVLKGKYDIKKGKQWKEDIEQKTMTVKNIEVFEKVIPTIFSLTKMFDIDSIKSIFEYCKKDTYNFSAISRIKTLANIIYNNNKNRLDIPIKNFMETLYVFVDSLEDGKCNKTDIDAFVNNYVDNYARSESSSSIPIWLSSKAMNNLRSGVERMMKCLINIGRANSEGFVSVDKAELLWNEKNVLTFDTEDDIFIKNFVLGDLLEDIPGDFEVTTDDVPYDDDWVDVIDKLIIEFNNTVKLTQLE